MSAWSGPVSLTLTAAMQRGRRYFAAEPGKAPGDIGGVADLAHLAIADDVDTDFDLTAHHLGYRLCDDRIVLQHITGFLALAGEEHVGHCLTAGQAADVRGEDAIGAHRARGLPRRARAIGVVGSVVAGEPA